MSSDLEPSFDSFDSIDYGDGGPSNIYYGEYDDDDDDGDYTSYGPVENIKIICYENKTIAGFQFIFNDEKIVQFTIIDNDNEKHYGYHLYSGSFAIDPKVLKKIIGFNLCTINEIDIDETKDYLKFSSPEDVEHIGGTINDKFDYSCGGPKKIYELQFSKDDEIVKIQIPCYKFYWNNCCGMQTNIWHGNAVL